MLDAEVTVGQCGRTFQVQPVVYLSWVKVVAVDPEQVFTINLERPLHCGMLVNQSKGAIDGKRRLRSSGQ